MTAYSTAISIESSSDTTFRAWAGVISNAFGTAWIQTSDIGQINLSTVTRPSTTTMAGYQIWRMNDSLQGSAPCFVKVEYGTGSSALQPAIGITIGTGSDGAGNITGNTVTTGRILMQAYGAVGSTVYTAKVSVSTNRICIYLWVGYSYPVFFSIERTHNSSGADTAAGILFFMLACWWNASTFSSYSFTVLPSITTTYGVNLWNVVLPAWTNSSAWSTNVFTYPIRTWGQGESSPSLNISMYHYSDLTALNIIPITWWDGIIHTSLPLGNVAAVPSYGASNANVGLIMIWE
ncbi:MAG: hypothetical protein JHC33_13815 [Ignisphaera sp.]|nr:hypothetical protein [Ignisphaera sp.]